MTQQLAQGIASLGRGPDSMLVHMAPSEVKSLQQIAMAHGGSLTINPQTGLPEAGFLSSILPIVAGFALGPAGFGMMSAVGAGLTVGGISALASGSLSKGLMAGLGAYGGAGIGEGLAAAAPEAVAAPTVAPAVAPPLNFSDIGTATSNAGSPTLLNAAQQANTGIGTGFSKALDPGATSAIYPTATPSPVFSTAPPPQIPLGPITPLPSLERAGAGLNEVLSSGKAFGNFASANAYPLGAAGLSVLGGMQPDKLNAPAQDPGMIRPYTYSREKIPSAFEDVPGDRRSSKERRYFDDVFTPGTPYKAPGPEYKADGGPVEADVNPSVVGAYTNYPQSKPAVGAYSTSYQQPSTRSVVTGAQDAPVDSYTGQELFADGGSIGGYTYDPTTGQYSGGTMSDYGSGNIGGYTYNPATQQYTQSGVTPEGQARRDAAAAPAGFDSSGIDSSFAHGGIASLGDYSDGGRLLRGPGDGVSDSIPAMIGEKQQARLADGEFVVPARIVSELGNGSTEAGARQLYAMMDRVQKNRKKSMGKDKVATDAKSSRLLPA